MLRVINDDPGCVQLLYDFQGIGVSFAKLHFLIMALPDRNDMIFSESLKKNRDFQYVYKNGRSLANRYLVMYVVLRETHHNRLGISVSKKVGNSVKRHRLTRLIRESYRLNEKRFVDGLDIVVIARPGAKEASFFEIESALLHLARKQHVLAEETADHTADQEI